MKDYPKVAITSILAVIVISSPYFIVVTPVPVLAVPTDSLNRVDSSNYHSTPRGSETDLPFSSATPTTMSPSTSNQSGGDFTTQAALSLTRASQTNNFVNSKAYYDISFRTATAGVIKTIEMNFPAGTFVGSSTFIEATGIGPGTVAASPGEVLTYTVTNAVNVPANTIIRIQMSNINNPPNPSNSLTVSITTRDSASVPIDGPTPTTAYNMVQVGNAQIAPGAVTTTKIATGGVTSGDIADGAITLTKPAESFMKRVTVADTPAGHAVGWNPDAATLEYTISEPDVSGQNTALISIEVVSGTNHFCDVTSHSGIAQSFTIDCFSAPGEGTTLHYLVENLPAHIIQ